MDLLAPPDIESAVVAGLSPAMSGAWVSTKYPRDEDLTAAGYPLNAPIIRASSNGGFIEDRVVAVSRILLECWGDTEQVSWDAAAESHARLKSLEGQTFAGMYFAHVDATLPTNHPDLNHQVKVRFQYVATIHSKMRSL